MKKVKMIRKNLQLNQFKNKKLHLERKYLWNMIKIK